jgi:putative colanic acid biosynthesis acetyltransferase WcaF
MTILDAQKTKPLEGGASFSMSNRALRALWIVSWTCLAAWTPAPFFAWRRVILRAFGARLAPTARVYGRTRIWYPPNLVMNEHALLGPEVNCYNQAPITVGVRAVVSQGAHLCSGTHDITDPNFQLVARPITIGNSAWVAAEAFVGPGVTIGEGAVLGARAVAFRDLEPWAVYVGNPAAKIKQRRLRPT